MTAVPADVRDRLSSDDAPEALIVVDVIRKHKVGHRPESGQATELGGTVGDRPQLY